MKETSSIVKVKIMTNTLIALGYFMISVLSDDLAVQWQQARERGQYLRGANLSVAMEVINWIPYLLLVTTYNWQIVIAAILGNWVGSYVGIKRHTPREEDASLPP